MTANPSGNSLVPHTFVHRVEADGINIFYREAGPKDAPVVLLLHGFPTSSFQYRHLIPRLADRYRVIAPDLPGFGFTEVPAVSRVPHTTRFSRVAQPFALFREGWGSLTHTTNLRMYPKCLSSLCRPP